MKRTIAGALLCAALMGCVDDTGTAGSAGEVVHQGEGADLLVVATDYATTSLSWVAASTPEVVARGFLHSGTVVSEAGSALSGDVVAGSEARSDGAVAVLDRFRGTLTWVGAGPLVQWRLSDGFLANPQDAWPLADGGVAVARAQSDPEPTDTLLSGGDDVLVLDAAGAPVRRLPLAAESTLPGGFAFAGRGVRRGSALWLPLASLAKDFSAAGPGRVVRVDLEAGVTQRLAVPGLRNCTRIVGAGSDASGSHASGSGRAGGVTGRLVGTCSGFFQDTRAAQRAASGVFAVDPKTGTLSVVVRGAELPAGGAVAAPVQEEASGRGWFVRYGEVGGAPDSLWRYAPDGTVTHVRDGGAAFTIGDLWLAPTGDRLWLTDAGAKGGDLVALAVTSGEGADALSVRPSGLPAVHLTWRGAAARGSRP